MPEISQTVTVNRPVNEVFRKVADMNDAESWQPDVKSGSMSDERMRVGLFVAQRRTSRVFGWKLDLNADVLDYTPNKMIRLKGVVGRFPTVITYSFESRGGATAVTETVDARTGCLYLPVGPFLSASLNGRTKRALNGLKESLEKRGGATSVTNFQDLPSE